ncbi:hypothetical protein HanOQP8_Chr08g0280171 [Helianthus annuus]|nr:hypothetical protein HanOQP8_Chr08g0280171 [Helianthus annuus]
MMAEVGGRVAYGGGGRQHEGKKIPLRFQSPDHYLQSFDLSLLENTGSQLAFSMEIMRTSLIAEVLSIRNNKRADLVEFTVGYCTEHVVDNLTELCPVMCLF